MQLRPPRSPSLASSLGGCVWQLSNITTLNIRFDVELKLVCHDNFRVAFMTCHIAPSVICHIAPYVAPTS